MFHNVKTTLGVYITVCLLKFTYSAYTVVEAIVGESVTLPCCISCADAEWTRFIPDKTRISSCVKWTCSVEPKFQKRFQFAGSANISMMISPVVYNDIGSYKCSCGGTTAELKLKVFFPTVVTASVLENITLPCYGDTRRDASDVQWKKAGQKVLAYNRVTGTVTPGKGFADRFVLTPDGFGDGNLSLLITSVHAADEGYYHCTIHDESREGEPRVVLLKVDNSKTDGCLGKGVAIGVILGVIIGVILAIAIGKAVGVVRAKVNNFRMNRGTPANPPVQAYGVPETEPLKTSSTQPFKD